MAEERSKSSISSLLDLNTIDAERNFIVVDKKEYEIRSIAEFSLIERHHMAQSSHALQNITKLGDPTVSDSHIQKAVDGLNKVFLQIVIGAEDLVDRLSEDQKGEVLGAFFTQALEETKTEKKSENTNATSTSKSVQDSSAFTEDHARNG